MGSISRRQGIRWLPNSWSEPASVLVLTSPRGYFVDLRILLIHGAGQHGSDPGPYPRLGALDWAFAGTSRTSPIDRSRDHNDAAAGAAGKQVSVAAEGDGPAQSLTVYTHLVDSREPNHPATNVRDEGVDLEQPDGTVLERGYMVRPETGRMTEYEERWVREDDGDEKRRGKVLVAQKDSKGEILGMIILLGRWAQGYVRFEGREAVQRWRRDDGEWGRVWSGLRDDDTLMPMDKILRDFDARSGRTTWNWETDLVWEDREWITR